MLAICYACQRFHQYVFGKSITVQTDHKPLLGIMDKPLHTSTARIQRMRLRLQRYDVHLVYRPGSTMNIADTLSRTSIRDTDHTDLYDDTLEVNVLSITTNRMEEIRDATKTDKALSMLKEPMMDGQRTMTFLQSLNRISHTAVKSQKKMVFYLKETSLSFLQA